MRPLRQALSFADQITRSPSVLGWAWAAFGGLLLLSGLTTPFLLPADLVGPAVGPAPRPDATPEAELFSLFDSFFHLYGTYAPHVAATLGLLALGAGVGILRRQEWSRRLGIGLSGAVIGLIAAFGLVWLYMLYRMVSLAAFDPEVGGWAILFAVFGVGMALFGVAILAVMSTPFAVSWRYLVKEDVRAAFARGAA